MGRPEARSWGGSDQRGARPGAGKTTTQDDDGTPSRPEPVGPLDRWRPHHRRGDGRRDHLRAPGRAARPTSTRTTRDPPSVRIIDEPGDAGGAEPTVPDAAGRRRPPPSCPTGPSRPPVRCRPCSPATRRDGRRDPAAHLARGGRRLDGPRGGVRARPCSATSGPSLGALDETRDTDQERRPWEFDLDSVKPGQPGPGATSPTDPRTRHRAGRGRRRGRRRAAERVRAGPPEPEPTGRRHRRSIVAADGRRRRRRPRPSVADADAAGSTAAADVGRPADDDAGRPSGTPRVGRARRSGLLPARLKAKRPDEDVAPVGEPLAAEPPGASVADVPGAGRRKPGLAGLAAADRAADQEHGPRGRRPPSTCRRRRRRPRSHAARRRLRGRSAIADRPPRSQRQLHARGHRWRPAGPGHRPTPARPDEQVRRQHRPPGRHRCGRGRRRPAGLQDRHRHLADPVPAGGHLRRRRGLRRPAAGRAGARPPCSAWSAPSR